MGVFDYIADGQMSIMDFMPKEEVKPKLNKGQRIYNLVLDVVETGTITRIWEVSNSYYGYSTDEDNITFWDDELGRTVFIDKSEVHNKANNLKGYYKVIRAEEMEVIKERNFIEVCKDSRVLIPATVKLLEGNMIYFNRWCTYHFLKIAESEEVARKLYEEKTNDILKEMNDKRLEVEIPVELKDMYLCQSGIWSEYEYVGRNGAVKKGETDEI